MSTMTLSQEELQEALSFYLNQRILRIPHSVTKVKFRKDNNNFVIPKEVEVEMEKTEEQIKESPKVTPGTPSKELGKGNKTQGPLDSALKGT